jgi:UDP-3-O-[3-hydroxymyristoyl] glucosamine N-acyltransferase
MIDPSIDIPDSCQIGSYVRIHQGVTLGENVRVDDFSILGTPFGNESSVSRLHIPDNSIIRSHCVIYSGAYFESKLETGHHVVIREGTRAGENLRVGNFSDVEGDCTIGDFCRFHGYVHVGKGSKIGSFVWLFSLVTLTNDPFPPSHVRQGVTIDDGVVVCVGCTLFPGAHVGQGTLISANTSVRGKIPTAVVHTDGKNVCPITKMRSFEHQLTMPWMKHFSDTYPEEAQVRLDELNDSIMLNVEKASAKI